MAGTRTARLLIQQMAKHLPPSASALRLLDVEGSAGAVLREDRPDLQVTVVHGDPSAWEIDADRFDAVVAYDRPRDQAFLAAALRALRPGGRLIMVEAAETDAAEQVKTLEGSGYTRILVETGIECPLPMGMLVRGEKPHTTDDTLARVKVASDNDPDLLNFDTYNGRYLFLLVRQTPNKPAWTLTPDDVIEWRVASLSDTQPPILLAFSSLPKAVSFMQPAVVEGVVKDVNKVAKFSRETAQAWDYRLLLNPTLDAIRGKSLSWLPIDPATAEVPDE